MRNQIFFTIVLSVLLFSSTSCSRYYYSTVNSVQRDVIRNDLNDFVQDDDLVSIIYSFYGQDLPVQITIHNKTDEPLFVDWQQSALIVEDEANNYVKGDARIKGNITGRTYTYRDYLFYPSVYTESYQQVGGRVEIPQNVSFIPPNSRITRTPITLANFSFEDIPDNLFSKRHFLTKNGQSSKVKVVDFKEYDSPLRFRSYLTLYTVDPKGERENSINYEQRFYLSRVVKAGGIAPENFKEFENKQGDSFFVRHEKGKNAALITGIVAIGVAGIVLDATLGGDYYYHY